MAGENLVVDPDFVFGTDSEGNEIKPPDGYIHDKKNLVTERREVVKKAYTKDKERQAIVAQIDWAIKVMTDATGEDADKVPLDKIKVARQIIKDLDEMKHGGVSPAPKDEGDKTKTQVLKLVNASGKEIDTTARVRSFTEVIKQTSREDDAKNKV